MEIKGFGSYTDVERHLATLTVDEKNELYLSGELDRMLDEIERKKLGKLKDKKRKGEMKGEVLPH
jgi:hypothetical protein